MKFSIVFREDRIVEETIDVDIDDFYQYCDDLDFDYNDQDVLCDYIFGKLDNGDYYPTDEQTLKINYRDNYQLYDENGKLL